MEERRGTAKIRLRPQAAGGTETERRKAQAAARPPQYGMIYGNVEESFPALPEEGEGDSCGVQNQCLPAAR